MCALCRKLLSVLVCGAVLALSVGLSSASLTAEAVCLAARVV